MNFIEIGAFTEQYDIKHNNVYTTVNYYKKMHNDKSPDWYKNVNREAFIDKDFFENIHRIKSDSWRFATDPEGIYWYLMNYITEMELAKKLANRSHRYKSVDSWYVWFRGSLWNTSMVDFKLIMEFRLEMLHEFVIHGSRILYALAQRHGIREHKEMAA